VKLTLLGETFQTRVAVYGGKYVLGVWKAVREQHGLREGQAIEATVEPDVAARSVEPPKELATALKKNAAARAGWKAISFTRKREWAKSIADAKKPDARARRLVQAVEALVAAGEKAKKG
jgi:uncharacterized protein YdeI (YjbR/CyaY-like superfamily)